MLIASLLLLSAVTVNGLQDNDHGPRRTKQLDLQDIQAPAKEEPTVLLVSLEKNPPFANGYLPPASPSTPQPIVGAQSIQIFEFEPLNSLEKEEPCSPASDSASCRPNNSSSSELKIPKPSRDLVPPFNELEQETLKKEEEKLASTTEKLVSASSVQVTTRITSKPVTSSTRKVFASKAEATNELRSYLPPQAAAQTNVAVVQPFRPNADHDHHHGHHHGKDFDICADAFHSFLCAPLKARKRITGAFPNSLRGQSSFINYQKLLPNYEPAPSNTLQNAYLPPKRVSSSPKLIQSSPTTARPIVTPTLPSRPPPKVIPEPSNTNDRFYLPPVSQNKILAAPSRESVFKFRQAKPTPSSRPAPVTSPRTPTRAPVILTTSSQPPVFTFSPSNENRFYLPPKINPQPVPSFTASSTVIHSVTPTFPPQSSVSASFPAISTSRKPQAVVTAAAKPQPSTSSPFVSSSSPTRAPSSFNSVLLTQKPFSTQNSFKFSGQSSSEDRSYLPPEVNLAASAKPQPSTLLPSQAPTRASQSYNSVSLTQKPFPSTQNSYKFSGQSSSEDRSYIPPDGNLAASAKPQPSTLSPFVTPSQAPTRAYNSVSPTPSTKKTYDSFKFTGQSSSEDRSYLPPEVNLAAAAQTNSAAVAPKNPFHHGRDLCTDPFHSFLCVSAKPRKRITGQLPSGIAGDSSNTQESRLRPDEGKLEGASAQDVGYKYPKPSPPPALPNLIPSSTSLSPGYSYPKPNQPSSLPNLIPSSTAASPGYSYPKPNQPSSLPNLIPSSTAASPGYSYPKPNQPSSLPNLIPSSTSLSPGYSYPKPNQPSSLPNLIPSSTAASPGYSYPKATKEQNITPISSTTAKSEPRPSEARIVSGYQYPKPDESFPLPGEQSKVPTTTSAPTTGYSYPKPQKPFPLPTEQKQVLQKLPPPKAEVASPTTQPRGYQYPRPDQGLKLPEKSGGYSYPKPAKRLELPTESRGKQSNPSLDSLGALGSAEFIPVNKIDFKRSESKLVAGLRRFGERQKKRQRETFSARKRGE